MHYRIGLIGSGIGPSLSPALHEREATALGLDYRYRRWDLDELEEPAEAVGALLGRARAQGYRGMNITHPCKQLVLPYLNAIAPDAAALGAVNTVVFDDAGVTGHNTDHSGFARSFRRGLPDAALGRVVLLGAGGAGAAVAQALLTSGVGELRVIDTDAARAAGLTAALRERGGGRVAIGGDLAAELVAADGLVHATPTGMADHPGIPVPARLLHPRLWVADVVYRPLATELVIAARQRGCRVLDGGGMAVFQAADAFRLFTGVEPDAERMLRHFTELVREGTHAAS